MVRITYSSPFTGETKPLRLKRPLSIGRCIDDKGNAWDVYDYIGGAYGPDGKAIVHARPIDNCPKYSTAPWDMNTGYDIKYLPYYVEWFD
jgi:hypothetical protein